jgi:hypothetical protein
MKTKCYRQAILLLLLVLFCFNVKAQDEPQVQLELKLTDKTANTSHNYKLYGINYSLSNPFYLQDESKLINNGSCSLMMELAQDADSFLLKWVGGSIKNVSGEISVIPIDGIKKPRKITFTDGQIAGSSESFYTTVGANSPVQLSIYVKTLVIDGTTIFTLSKPANQ